MSMASSSASTLGSHLARRLVQIGVTDIFSVPGDFNLTLLDHLIAEKGLTNIGCSNELSAGYAADGYARARGVSACVVTFTVGSLSLLNAIAGAYSENYPIICIVGGPNSNDYGGNRIIHHTVGLPDFNQELRCFENVTCYQAVVRSFENALELVDTAISTALRESKPVYISISCNLVAIPHATLSKDNAPLFLAPRLSNQGSLEAAVEAAGDFLNKAVKPILVGGPRLREAKAEEAFVEMAEACGYPMSVMPPAKGLVPEQHPQFIGLYWGPISSAFCEEAVESSDGCLFAGPMFNETCLLGYTLPLRMDNAVVVQPNRVVVADRQAFGCVLMKDFLRELANKLKRNTTAMENYHRSFVPESTLVNGALTPKEPLTVNVLYKHVQEMLTSEMTLVSDASDSWFKCLKLKLPRGCRCEFQMQYASIGWSVGAILGYAQAEKNRRVLAFIGDGSFQMTAQGISMMLRCEQKSIIFLLNNGGYTIEAVLHDNSYNVIDNWNYTALVEAMDNGRRKCWTAKVKCKEELKEAIEMATGAKKDCLCFIEVFLHRKDASQECLVFGKRVGIAANRPPNPL